MNEATHQPRHRSPKKPSGRSRTQGRSKPRAENKNQVEERPVVQPSEDEPDMFGRSLYAANIEDTANAILPHNPVGIKDKLNPMKGFIVPVKPHIQPETKEANLNIPPARLLGPIPPPFRTGDQGRRNSTQLPPIKDQSRNRDGFEPDLANKHKIISPERHKKVLQKIKNIPPLQAKPDYTKFVAKGDTFYSEQEDEFKEGAVPLQKNNIYETINFLKENINQKLPILVPQIYELPEPKYVRPERLQPIRPPSQKKDIVPTQKIDIIPDKTEFVNRPPAEYKGPENIDFGAPQDVPKKDVSVARRDQLFNDDTDKIDPGNINKDTLPQEPTSAAQTQDIFQTKQNNFPKRPPPKKKVTEPLEGFQVPLIADQDPKKLFENAPLGTVDEDTFVGARRARNFTGVYQEPDISNTREPSFLPNFNWEPVQVQKNYYLIPDQLKVFGSYPNQEDQAEIFSPDKKIPFSNDDESRMPLYKKLMIAFVKEGEDGKGRRAYMFNLSSPLATIFDLKEAIKYDFGYEISQQKIFKNYLETHDGEVITNLPFEHEEEVMIFGHFGDPAQPQEVLPKKVREKTMNDIRQINCSNISPDELLNLISEENLVLPPYRDWNYEWQQIYIKARELKTYVSVQEYTAETREMAQLLELERLLVSIINDFKIAAIKAVQLIDKRHLKPVYLDNMFGKGGLKYVIGGMVIRECRNWILLAKDLGEGNLCYKVAANELRAFDFLKGKIPNLEIPLCCMINYNGTGYFAQSICPITCGSIIYGSNTEGIDITIDERALEMVLKVSRLFNTGEHVVYDRVTRVGKHINLAFDCEIHLGEDNNLYLLNPSRIWAPDIINTENLYEINGKFLRPEFQSEYCSDELEDNYVLCTWKKPVRCEECQKIINDYEFYYYEKRGLNKERTLYLQYYYCLNCYAALRPTNGFKIGVDKLIRKVVPLNERNIYWLNLQTGETFMKKPNKKIPLNPDANVMFPEFSTGAEKEYIQKENLNDQRVLIKASKFLREEIIRKFIYQLNTLEITIRSSREFSYLMHERGINLRYLGMVAAEAKYNYLKELAIREIMVRSIKGLIRDGLSFLKKQSNKDFDVDAKKFIIYYLNEIFTLTQRESSLNIWQLLSDLARNKFNINIDKTILTRLHLPALIYRLFQALNIKMTKLKGFTFQDPHPFSMADIISINPKIKIRTKYPLSINTFLQKAREKDALGKRSKWYLLGGPEREEATEIFRQAAIASEYIYGKDSQEAGEAFREVAKHLEERHAENGKPEYSQWNKCANVPEDGLSVEARDFYEKAIHAFAKQYGDYDPIIAECLVSLACLHKDKIPSFKGVTSKVSIQYLLSAIEIYDVAVSADHPDTAALCVKIALAYKEGNLMKEAYSWIQRAFCSFFHIFGPDDEITIQIYDHVKSIGLYFDPDIARIPIEDLCNYIEAQIFGQN